MIEKTLRQASRFAGGRPQGQDPPDSGFPFAAARRCASLTLGVALLVLAIATPVAGVQTGVGPAATGAGEPTAPGAVIRWLFYLSIVGAVGTTGFRILVLGPLARAAKLEEMLAVATRRSWFLAWAAGILGLVILPARLWDESVRLFGGNALGPSQLGGLVFRSAWGWGWLLEVVVTVLFLAGAAWARSEGRRRRGWLLMGSAAAGLVFVPALSGHAWTVDSGRIWAVLSHALHVLAAGLWVGGLGALLLAGLPALKAADPPAEGERAPLPRLVDAFSRLALGAVTLLVGTGILNAWIHLSGLGQLFSTSYGRVLLIKLALAAGALALGFYNRVNVRPSLDETPQAGLLRIPASMELLLALAVLGVVAVLVAIRVPGSP